MSKLRLRGSTSGYTEIQASAVAGDNIITLPTTSDGTILTADSSGNVNIDSGTLYVDATNNRVGIGTTSVTAGNLLEVRGRIESRNDSTSEYAFYARGGYTSGGEGGIRHAAGLLDLRTAGSYALTFSTNNSEVGRFDTSGRLLVGTSSALSDASNARVEVSGDLVVNTISTGVGSEASLRLYHLVNNSSATRSGAKISSVSTDAYIPGDASSADSDLTFSTTLNASLTERMRIGSNGTTYLGTQLGTNYGNNEPLSIAGNCGDKVALITMKDDGAAGSDRNYIRFHDSAGTKIGAIEHNNTNTVAYLTSSDYRLKENVVLLTGAADRLKQLPVRRFNFIADPDKTVDGFLAHEAQAVVPECVSGTKDEVDADGNPVYQGIDQSKLVPLLTAALQEALQKIEDLEGRLTAAGL